jgi:hypothetical protein
VEAKMTRENVNRKNSIASATPSVFAIGSFRRALAKSSKCEAAVGGPS